MNDSWNRYVDIPCMRDINCPVMLDGISCDGYIPDKNTAVITHFHHDHIADMADIMYGCDKILMHPITYAAMSALNKSLTLRQGIIPLEYNVQFQTGNVTIQLLDACHIPGSCQVLVQHDGKRLMYSGDFGHLNTNPPKCDYLVLDATHGDPTYNYDVDRDGIIKQMHETILEETSKNQSIMIHSSRGTLQEIMSYMESGTPQIDYNVRFIASKKEIDVFNAIYPSRANNTREMIRRGSMDAYEAIRDDKPCIMFVSDLNPNEDTDAWFSIHVDRYRWFRNDMPGIFNVENGIRCNLSSHASYSDIMEFVRNVEPEFVLTDSSRSGCAGMLAERIRKELHIEAVASHVKPAVN